jgi:dipeptidase
MWGAEIGANEHGVVIGNEAVFTNQPHASLGLTGMDLLRLALERSSTAQHACDTIRELIASFGQGGGCGLENRSSTCHNSFLIADSCNAILLETAGNETAVEEIQGTRTISNGLTIPGFARKYRDRLKSNISACDKRQQRTQALSHQAHGVLDMIELLSDHGAGNDQPHYHWANGGMGATCMHAGGLITSAQTTASWIAELRPDSVRHWVTATAAPCTGIFKPVHLNEPIDLGPWPADRFDPRCLWWRHEDFHRQAVRCNDRIYPLFQSDRRSTHERWVRAAIEPRDAFTEADRLLSLWKSRLVEVVGMDARPSWVRRYWRRRDEWAQRPNPVPSPTKRD